MNAITSVCFCVEKHKHSSSATGFQQCHYQGGPLVCICILKFLEGSTTVSMISGSLHFKCQDRHCSFKEQHISSWGTGIWYVLGREGVTWWTNISYRCLIQVTVPGWLHLTCVSQCIIGKMKHVLWDTLGEDCLGLCPHAFFLLLIVMMYSP